MLHSEKNTIQVRSQKHRIQIECFDSFVKNNLIELLRDNFVVELGMPSNMIGLKILNPANWRQVAESIAKTLEDLGYDICRVAAPNNDNGEIVDFFVDIPELKTWEAERELIRQNKSICAVFKCPYFSDNYQTSYGCQKYSTAHVCPVNQVKHTSSTEYEIRLDPNKMSINTIEVLIAAMKTIPVN